MTKRTVPTLLIALSLAHPGIASVDVRVSGESVDVQATNAPVSEVLDRLSKQTQMKIVYDGTPPRQTITLDLRGRTPVEAVQAALEGLGVNYALSMDPSGTRVETLLVSGTASAAPPTRAAANEGPRLPREMQQEMIQQEEPEPMPEDEGQVAPDSGAGLNQAVPGKESVPEPVTIPEAGVGGFSASPFAPTAKPFQPQPEAQPTQAPPQPPQPQATPPPFNP